MQLLAEVVGLCNTMLVYKLDGCIQSGRTNFAFVSISYELLNVCQFATVVDETRDSKCMFVVMLNINTSSRLAEVMIILRLSSYVK